LHPQVFLVVPHIGAKLNLRLKFVEVFSTFYKEMRMNLQDVGHHLVITPAIRLYVNEKMSRITRHFDQVMTAQVVLAVEKLVQKAEVTIHVSGKEIHASAVDSDMYAAIDLLTDKLDRQVLRHKSKIKGHASASMKRSAVEIEVEVS